MTRKPSSLPDPGPQQLRSWFEARRQRFPLPALVSCRPALVLAMLALGSAALGGTDRLALRVSPSVIIAPADLFVRAVVEANQDNRAIEISAESGDFYRSTEIQLDGERAQRTTTIEFRSLPRGKYLVRATLKGSAGRSLASTMTHVNVIDDPSAGR